ncbi:MAG TPA: AMP-binding protein [Deltaproteobacteria bacterium]|nr:AMP-binding protein [Deltaproteobacteria bacterium]
MNVADIVIRGGTDPCLRDRVLLLSRQDSGEVLSVTYGELYARSLAYGALIDALRREQGIAPPSRFHVGVFMQNIPEFFFLLFGCAFTNATLVGVNNAQVGEKLAFDINNIDMHVLVADHAPQPGTDGTFLDTVLRARDQFGFTALKDGAILVVDPPSGEPPAGACPLSRRLAESKEPAASFQPEPLDVSRPGVIIFTSGTTGAPKGIEVTWQKLYDTGVTGTRILSYTGDDVGYVCMPVNHSNALYLNIMPALLNYAKIFVRRRFSASNFVKDLADSETTVWNCVGDPVQYVLNHVHATIGPRADFSHLPIRTVISTGTNAPNRAAFTRMFGLDIFTEVYGSTEAGAITAVDASTPDYSVGRLLKDVRIVDEATGSECALARVDASGRILNLNEAAGEIVVSQESLGASAFTGYYRLPAESAKKIMRLDGKDFYRMGDLGAVVEQDGAKYLVFLGRTGDWIRFKGENWTPVDAEKVVGRYEGVTNAGVIGVPQARGREDDPMYVIEVEDPAAFDPAPFLSHCREHLPHYMQPRFIRVVCSVPLTETMKLKKSVLKAEFYERTAGHDASTDDIVYVVENGRARRFLHADYLSELALFTDPTNRDTLQAYTKRADLFSGRGGRA